MIWHDGPVPATGPGTLLGAKINAATGKRIGAPFTLATLTLDPAAWVTGISVSYDSTSRKALLVYSENALGAIFQVRGVLFEVD